ncbi:MAG: helix-turn-helix transcriptional regulator [Spirochaetales bacterium]|nr:helix-turn-helix transcriptional regulator [Spirochaetales bacterium]
MENRAVAPLLVRSFGLISEDPFHFTPGTRQGDVMLTIFLKGEGRFKQGSLVHKVCEGMIGLVIPEDEGMLLSNSENPYTHYYLRFSGEYARYLTCQIREQRGGPFFQEPLYFNYSRRLEHFSRFIRRDLPVDMNTISAAVLGILVDLLNQKEEGERPLDSVSSLISFLEERISKPTSLDELAWELNVSRSTLTSRCRQLSGKSVQRLHEELKMEWARQLLKTGNIRIGEAALRLGYQDALYFSKVFKKHFSCSPREYLSRSIE